MTKAKAWILAARPKTLSASLVPIIATVGLVRGFGYEIQWWIVVLALFSSFFIQIGTNLVNDAMDFKKGADTEKRLGPVRVTQQGIFTFNQVMLGAGICFALSAACGIPLVIHGGWPILAVGIFSILMGYAYTSGPLPLAYYGLGDLFVILFFGLVAVGGLFYLLTGTYGMPAFIVGLQIGFLSTVLIAINNLRDIHTDVLVNKKTMAVRLGLTGSRFWVGFLVFAPFFGGYYWLSLERWWVYIIPLVSFPIGLFIVKRIFRTEPGIEYNRYLALSSLYSLIFSVLLAVGFQIPVGFRL
ncbi:1,4-dihydroxy-2-naphthoate octaprenyltransferase [Pseudobdellovibrio exovorus]|uniref:1,4-dihydroxy-2-naphthoate octaprenyltransferase n=1 Tax=Pseudobdellovibrio exovorus JSS TaxID=1184267 RepID=M4VNU8_9BACT|nr:1,4-dihydroxy-2-naphthoate octaprenyltransferase [Pseudobdellovibrio exovorus]AGH94799.1 1,4-dihydroxy-2-naphthoate octaprenyltransferase [Pseudobdellovibrio exovorus JSS]